MSPERGISDTLTHLNTFSHLPISIDEYIEARLEGGNPNIWNLWQSDMNKDIDEELRNRKRKYSPRRWNSLAWYSYTILLPSLSLLSQPENLGSVVKGEQAAHLWTCSYLRHGPILVGKNNTDKNSGWLSHRSRIWYQGWRMNRIPIQKMLVKTQK